VQHLRTLLEQSASKLAQQKQVHAKESQAQIERFQQQKISVETQLLEVRQ